jgi:proteasome lid subunit RPN8/RPN11
MRWTDQSAPIVLQPVAAFLERLAASDAAAVHDTLRAHGVGIVLGESVTPEAERHVTGVPYEQGGLLVGEAFVLDSADSAVELVFVRTAVPSDSDGASAVSLRMGTSVWSRAQAALRPGERVVGWFHSHPGLGAFFSETDRRTQAGFFNHPFSVGWVIDPWRREQAWFLGADAAEVEPHAVVVLGTL